VFAGATRNILVPSEKPYQDLLVCIKFSASRSGQQDIGKLGYLGTEIKIYIVRSPVIGSYDIRVTKE